MMRMFDYLVFRNDCRL